MEAVAILLGALFIPSVLIILLKVATPTPLTDD